MFEFLERLEAKQRAKDPAPPLEIYDAPVGHGGRRIRTDGAPPPAEKRRAVDTRRLHFTESKKVSEYAPPSHNEQFLAFKHQLEGDVARGDLAQEVDQLDRDLKALGSSLPARETAGAKLEPAQQAAFRTAVLDARSVIAEARAEGATDDEILREAATISPTCEKIYAALL